MTGPSRIGVVGLGNMGWEVADCFAHEGHSLLVHDARPEVEARFINQHSDVSSLTDRWEEIDALVLVLPNSDIVDAVVGDVVERLRPRALVIDMSSSDPVRTRSLSEQVMATGRRFVDAPVSGGVAGARARRLAILIGGQPDDVAETTSLVAPLAKSVIHVGEVGAGHAAKALNNLVSAGALSLTVEALHAAASFGVDRERMLEVLNSSSGRTNTSENKVAQFMFSGSFGSGFSQHLMAKDVAIGGGLVRKLNLPITISERVEEQWAASATQLDPGADHTEMYRMLSAASESEG